MRPENVALDFPERTQAEEWARNRKQPKKELAARALALLDKAGNKPVEPGDELQHDDEAIVRRQTRASRQG